jgi:hypothetical protein
MMLGSAPSADNTKIELGDRFEMHHPRLGRLDIFEAVEISDLTIRLRATGAGYWNEIDRMVVGQIENLVKYRLAATPTPRGHATRFRTERGIAEFR